MTFSIPSQLLQEQFETAYILRLPLETSAADVRTAFGDPANTFSTSNFRVYDYDEADREQFGWSFVFDTPGDRAVCITRRFTTPRDLSALFPPESTTRHESRGAVALVRRLGDGRVLIGIGRQQLVLMRANAVERFFPWLTD